MIRVNVNDLYIAYNSPILINRGIEYIYIYMVGIMTYYELFVKSNSLTVIRCHEDGKMFWFIIF